MLRPSTRARKRPERGGGPCAAVNGSRGRQSGDLGSQETQPSRGQSGQTGQQTAAPFPFLPSPPLTPTQLHFHQSYQGYTLDLRSANADDVAPRLAPAVEPDHG